MKSLACSVLPLLRINKQTHAHTIDINNPVIFIVYKFHIIEKNFVCGTFIHFTIVRVEQHREKMERIKQIAQHSMEPNHKG